MAGRLQTAGRRAHTQGSVVAFPAVRRGVLGVARALFLSMPAVSAAPMSFSKEHSHDEDHTEGPSLAILLIASAVLVLLGGAFAGLTIA